MGGAMRHIGTWRPGMKVRETTGRHPLVVMGMHALAWGLVPLLSMLSLPAVGQPAAADLLESLNLSGYPPGTKPPEFAGHTLEGRGVSLADLQGRVVLLSFWASWCQECRPEMPAFEQLHRDFAAQGLTVLGVNVREGTPAIRLYAKELSLTFPLVLDRKGEIAMSYGVSGLPITFLIGRDGRAVARAIGPREWGAAPARVLIQALLAEPVAQKAAP